MERGRAEGVYTLCEEERPEALWQEVKQEEWRTMDREGMETL